jgi:ketosteroid isomerase-like protein
MNREHRDFLVRRFLEAWTSQDVERVLDCYTDDVRYHDPNTRGDVTGRESMRHYLTRLFAGWQMTWAAREVFDLKGQDGVTLLWRATFRRAGREQAIEIDGMDLALLRGDRVARNEVYFDRAALG